MDNNFMRQQYIERYEQRDPITFGIEVFGYATDEYQELLAEFQDAQQRLLEATSSNYELYSMYENIYDTWVQMESIVQREAYLVGARERERMLR